jgi:predicted lipid-binding transport protein (Tim44 family)
MALALAVVPAVADAKAGGGSSMGSRGAKTFQPNIGKPIERSITPPPAVAPPMDQSATALQPQAASSAPGFFQRHPFVGGLLGGFVGAGIGAMLFGGHMFGGGFGGILSLLLQILIIVFLVRWAIGFFRRRSERGNVPRTDFRLSNGAGSALAPARAPDAFPSFALSDADLSTFERLLMDIQAAWSHEDVSALRRLTTPEIAGYMEGQLLENGQKGMRNRVEQVHLLKGDIVETWREGAVDYATVSLKWSAVDYMLRAGGTEILSGDPSHPAESDEIWTMVRHLNGPWQLSAIQQR